MRPKTVLETVLPQEVRKLTSTIEEKDAALALKNNDLQCRDNQIQAIKYENVALQSQRDVYQAQLQKCQDTITHLKTTLSSLYKNSQNLPTINMMTCHIISRGYNDVKGMLS